MNYDNLRSKKDRGPYDSTLEDTFPMYDNMPYIRDISICNQEYLGLLSGNIIKYYRCKFSDNMKAIIAPQ